MPVPAGRRLSVDQVPVGSYNPPDSVLGTSPSRVGDGEFSEDSGEWFPRGSKGKLPMSLPSNGIGFMEEARFDFGGIIK